MKLRYDDNRHAYWFNGSRCRGVSTVAKIPDDTYALTQWVKRTVAVGMASRPDLTEAVAAHHTDRDKLDELVEQAIEAAKANDASRRGTAKHRITERHDTGETLLMTDLARDTIAQWQGLLDAHRLTVVPELIERIVVHPDLMIAGRYDRILQTVDGRLVIADLKTGANQAKHPHSIAVQLALYAHAPLLAAPLNGSGEVTEFDPMPDVDKTVGYVLHLPDSGEAQLLEVDIAAGWECVQTVIVPTLQWRKRQGLARPVTPPGREPADSAALLERIAGLSDSDRQLLKKRWPLPGVKAADIAWAEQVGAVEKVIDDITRWQPQHTPRTKPDEGAPLAGWKADELRQRYQALGPAKAFVDALAAEANAAGVTFSLSDAKTERRYRIGRALVSLAERDELDTDLVRLLAASAIGDATYADSQEFTTGAVIGLLGAREAARFAVLVDAHLAGAPLHIDEHGLFTQAA